MNLITKTILTLVTLIFIACGGGESSSTSESDNRQTVEALELANTVDITETQYFRVLSPKNCEQENKNQFIYQVMHDSYLWSNDVPELDFSDSQYNSSEKMLTALKSNNDKFSFIIDAQTAQSFFEEGKNNDFGMGLTVAQLNSSTNVLAITYIYPDSPADKAGLKRGDIITHIESKSITSENIDAIVDILDNQKIIKFTFLEENNSTNNKTITKESYSIKTFLYSNIFTNDSGNKRVGYLVFQDFIQNALQEMNPIFKTFKDYNVNELILDLRYNGGGAVNVANHLSSLIGGVNVSENIFNHTNFNDRYSNFNDTSYFETHNNNALNLNRVFVITTPSTCSSSELVINALKASANNIEVIQIGSTTCGKPYGFLGSGKFCDKALFAINVESKNGDDIGNYVNGLSPTCPVQDNYFKDFGDTSEDSLNEALNYITTGKCTTKTLKQQKVKQVSDFQLPKDGFKRIMSAY
ncbi:MAG TPA: PDZ domain-containing protein [Arcobacter sp.]|nr:PDZ domain-containing protein [Arcobacter sp.]